jgi:radical SAM superfamily enzyme YgiQ (UPF0313 family)
VARFVLLSDLTLIHDYHHFPLLDFLPCAPSGSMPLFVYEYLKGRSVGHVRGRMLAAPYGLRKLEAALLTEFGEEEVVTAHPDFLEYFIKEDTEIIGIYTMDPLGLGPLTVSYSVLFNNSSKPFVLVEFEKLVYRINRARRGTRAKLVVGGPGVWEFMMRPDELDRLNIDYACQGEIEDVACELFRMLARDASPRGEFFRGFQTFDEKFRMVFLAHDKFITRSPRAKRFPSLEEVPKIRAPAYKGLVEAMRGCGINCDFCEVTLRPLRYFPPEYVRDEILVNMTAGYDAAWVHSDEIFAYRHGRNYEPNADALKELFGTVMGIKGIRHSNPTHGRISIPAGYPEVIRDLSAILRASAENWIGIQPGIETGSDRLAMKHMPNKTLPLRIGPDGTWKEIVLRGTKNLNRYFWFPAFTVQVGQFDERPEDNWETIALINQLGIAEVNGRPLVCTVTPMQNVPLGLLKGRSYFTVEMVDASQMAVYYAAYRHLMKIAIRNSGWIARGNIVTRAALNVLFSVGSWALLHYIETLCRKKGVDIERVKRYGIDGSVTMPQKLEREAYLPA